MNKNLMCKTGNFRQKRMIHYPALTPFITLISLAHHVSVTSTTWSHTAKYIFFQLLIYTLHVRAYEPFVVRPKKKLYKYTNSILISCFRVYLCEHMWGSVCTLPAWFVLLGCYLYERAMFNVQNANKLICHSAIVLYVSRILTFYEYATYVRDHLLLQVGGKYRATITRLHADIRICFAIII